MQVSIGETKPFAKNYKGCSKIRKNRYWIIETHCSREQRFKRVVIKVNLTVELMVLGK